MNNLQDLTIDFNKNLEKLGPKGASCLGLSLANCTKITNLKVLLSFHQIGVKGVHQFMLGVSNLVNIQYLFLNLNQNGIGDSGLSKLSSFLSKFSSLQSLYLNLNYNQISSKSVSSLSSGLEHCPELKDLSLSLSNNEINAKGGAYLGSALSKLKNLEQLTLILEQNQIGNGGMLDLYNGIISCGNVLSLTQKGQNFTTEENLAQRILMLQKIPNLSTLNFDIFISKKTNLVDLNNSFVNLKNLTILNLESRFEMVSICSLIQVIANCVNLQQLTLDLINYSRITTEIQCQSLDMLNSLHTLFIKHLSYDEQFHLNRFLASFADCRNLSSLTILLQHTSVVPELEPTFFSEALAKYQKLSNLSLSLNYYQGIDIKKFSQVLANNSNLERLALHLRSTQITVEGIHELGIALQKCLTLKKLILDLRDNLFQQSSYQSLSSIFQVLPQLSYFNLIVTELYIVLVPSSDKCVKDLISILPKCKILTSFKFQICLDYYHQKVEEMQIVRVALKMKKLVKFTINSLQF
ncbi:hypothetical protein ABPG74_006838 [Tetrahymena malaccensis]